MKLKKNQMKILKEKVTTERQRIQDNMKRVNQEDLHLKEDDRFDEVDQASSEYERSQVLRFRNRDMFYFKKLTKALEKFEEGEYGICEECDGTIKFERLLARPTAELCIGCKDDAEKEEQGNFVARQSKSMGVRVELTGAR